MAEEIKRIDIKEFRQLGFLQEVNRRFLHPLGLALEVIIDEKTEEEKLGGVWDYRDDPEGMFFAEDMIKIDRAKAIEELRQSKIEARKNNPYKVPVNDDGIQLK
jgi:hypothetical protein